MEYCPHRERPCIEPEYIVQNPIEPKFRNPAASARQDGHDNFESMGEHPCRHRLVAPAFSLLLLLLLLLLLPLLPESIVGSSLTGGSGCFTRWACFSTGLPWIAQLRLWAALAYWDA
ncbi:hypothetical protein VTI28DRAFT_2829 [Corynascus sepedonium]